MTQQEKEQISKLRANGASFGKIASTLGMSVNTVKSYCKRNPMSTDPMPASKAVVHPDRCPQCNAMLEQSSGHRQKRFCSPKCRIAWWAAHPEQMTRKKLFSVECQHCGGVFMQYGSRPRKFCSRGCYLAHRYGQGGDAHGGSNPLAARVLPDIFRKGILRQLSFSLRTQARKVKLLSALVFFTPPRSIWCILEFCQIV